MHICRSHAPWAPWDYASPLIVVKAVSQRMLARGVLYYGVQMGWQLRLLGTKKDYYSIIHTSTAILSSVCLCVCVRGCVTDVTSANKARLRTRRLRCHHNEYFVLFSSSLQSLLKSLILLQHGSGGKLSATL